MSGDALLQCPVCLNMGAFESAEMLRHRLILISSEKIVCPVCQEEVISVDKLITHLLSHLNLGIRKCVKAKSSETEKPNQLSPKNKTAVSTRVTSGTSSTSSTSTVKYVKIYPKLPVVAVNAKAYRNDSQELCDPFVPTVKKDTVEAEINTTCNMCALQFIDANILKMHMCLIHNIEDDSYQNVTCHQCHLCPKVFKMRGSLMVHLRVAHFGFSSDSCNTDKVSEENKTSLNALTSSQSVKFLKNENKQWQCDVCKKFFTTKYFLKKHKRLHTGETPYACTQCNKTFTFQQSYHKHLLYHNDEKPHCCNVCGRAFKELSTLHNHQRIHTGEKPFSCETCGKSFRQRVSYLVHRRIHTGAMPYQCTACEKSFRYKVSQRTHKCQAQPPGTVIRQSENLVEKLKKKNIGHDKNKQSEEENDIMQVIEFPVVSKANAELVLNGAKLSLEDTETEHFDLITQAFADSDNETLLPEEYKNTSVNATMDHNLEELIDSIPIEENNVPSPSEILKNLCLSTDIYDENMIL